MIRRPSGAAHPSTSPLGGRSLSLSRFAGAPRQRSLRGPAPGGPANGQPPASKRSAEGAREPGLNNKPPREASGRREPAIGHPTRREASPRPAPVVDTRRTLKRSSPGRARSAPTPCCSHREAHPKATATAAGGSRRPGRGGSSRGPRRPPSGPCSSRRPPGRSTLDIGPGLAARSAPSNHHRCIQSPPPSWSSSPRSQRYCWSRSGGALAPGRPRPQPPGGTRSRSRPCP